jgi:hypothetical protein
MAKKNLKKTEHVSEGHEIPQNVVDMSNLKSVLQEKKDDLIPILDNKELI